MCFFVYCLFYGPLWLAPYQPCWLESWCNLSLSLPTWRPTKWYKFFGSAFRIREVHGSNPGNFGFRKNKPKNEIDKNIQRKGNTRSMVGLIGKQPRAAEKTGSPSGWRPFSLSWLESWNRCDPIPLCVQLK